MARQTVCNWCGKVMTPADECGGISLHTTIGYGTVFDGADIDLDLCPVCTEAFIRLNAQKCMVSMIPGEYAEDVSR